MSNVTLYGFPRSTFVMDALPTVVAFNAKLPPRTPIQHAREWVHHHRPAA